MLVRRNEMASPNRHEGQCIELGDNGRRHRAQRGGDPPNREIDRRGWIEALRRQSDPVVVPCHRAIGADSRPTGYAGALRRKEWLLRRETGALQAS